MQNQPSANGGNEGRDRLGRFAPGWKGGPGNPHAQRVAQLRSAMLEAISPKDIQQIIRQLVAEAKGGDVRAAAEVLDRVLGKAHASMALEMGTGGFVVNLIRGDAPAPVEVDGGNGDGQSE